LNDDAIIVENVSKSFSIPSSPNSKGSKKLTNKKFKVLDNISFTVKKGEVLGIIGLNGSGKTTLLRLIAGIYKPDTGKIKVNGSIAPLLQMGVGFHSDLLARENIIMNGLLLGMKKQVIENKVDKIIEYAELERFQNLQIRFYSAGMKSRLSFAMAMEIDPDIVLVDEILSVGDKNFRKKSLNSFLSLKKKGKTILHSTHNIGKISEYSERALLLAKGKQVMIGDTQEVVNEYLKIKS
jgi:ABC-type polysaccharide/polyol phosphate transport system ATPase subunit